MYTTTTVSETTALAKGGYIIGHKIGEGIFSTVHSAAYGKDRCNSLQLACKIIDRAKMKQNYIEKFFSREIDIIKKIRHPNIIQIHSIIQRGPKIYIFMELALNGDLFKYLRDSGPLEDTPAKAWFVQLARALKYLHSNQIAHRDLKCENILISKNFNVKLTDFGFARYCYDNNGEQILSRTYCGSTPYAAPEVVRGYPYDPKLADAWSLGVILFIMLNAKMPFDDRNMGKFLADQSNRNFVFTAEHISPAAKATVRMLLEPELKYRCKVGDILNCNWVRLNDEGD